MPTAAMGLAPSLASFKSLVKSKPEPLETLIEYLISLLKHRQLHGSRVCAEATALLLRRLVEGFEAGDVSELVDNVQQIGQRLVKAVPKELAVGNIVRRVLGLIREEVEEDRESESHDHGETNSKTNAQRTKSLPRHVTNGPASGIDVDGIGLERIPKSTAAGRSVFGLLPQSDCNTASSAATSNLLSSGAPQSLSTETFSSMYAAKDLRAEVVEGILEIIEELKQADEQIASYAVEHIHSNEIILTHTSSETVRKFLLKAATKRKFTVIHAESYPIEHETTHALVTGEKIKSGEDRIPSHFQKTLSAAGISVILIPDSAIFAMMSRVNKVILDTYAVVANGGLISAAGAKQIAQAAQTHRTPVLILSGIYKFSPVHPFDSEAFLEQGDPGKVIPYEEGEFMDKVNVENPLFDYVPADLVDLYVTNIGGYAPSYVYRIIADHYRSEDVDLESLEPCQ